MSNLSPYNSDICPEPEQFSFGPCDLALNAFFVSLLKTSEQLVPIANRDRNQIRSLVIQAEVISDLLYPLDT